MKIVVTCAVTEAHKKLLEKIAPGHTFVYVGDSMEGTGLSIPVERDVINDADVIIGNADPHLLKQAEKLKWLQLNSAGVGSYVDAVGKDVLLTNATGAYGVAVAEHMAAQLLMMMKRLPAYYDNQKVERWHDEGPVQSVFGAKVLVVGYGDIGATFGRILKGMGARVTAVRRRLTKGLDGADAVATLDDLDSLLPQAQVVACVLPDTPETAGLFTKERLGKMKKHSWFINAGRGNVVDSDALCDAVATGRLAGAALDVTEPEPLPQGHRLWHTPGIYITPHVSGGLHLEYTHNRIIQIAARNLELFLAGKALEHEVDRQSGYGK